MSEIQTFIQTSTGRTYNVAAARPCLSKNARLGWTHYLVVTRPGSAVRYTCLATVAAGEVVRTSQIAR